MVDVFGRDEDIEHGTVSGYRKEYRLGLDRCDACRAAYSADRLKRKHKQAERVEKNKEETMDDNIIAFPTSSFFDRIRNNFVPNSEGDYENFGIAPMEQQELSEDEEMDMGDSELEALAEYLEVANQAQVDVCAILIENNRKLFEHLMFQHLTLVDDIDMDLATRIAALPYLVEVSE